MAQKIKKGDQVVVLTGRDKGKRGAVLKVLPTEAKVIVQGVALAKHHTRPSALTAGGIEQKERAIHISNVAYVDPKSEKPTRVGFKTLKDGRKVRVARASGEVLDA